MSERECRVASMRCSKCKTHSHIDTQFFKQMQPTMQTEHIAAESKLQCWSRCRISGWTEWVAETYTVNERKQFSSKLNNLTSEVLAEAHYRIWKIYTEKKWERARDSLLHFFYFIHTWNELKHTEYTTSYLFRVLLSIRDTNRKICVVEWVFPCFTCSCFTQAAPHCHSKAANGKHSEKKMSSTPAHKFST